MQAPALVTARHCQIGEDLACLVCGRKFTHRRVIVDCHKGDRSFQPWKKQPKHRYRTDEEYVTITHICQACEHFTGELCSLKKSGCRACQSAAKFAQWKMSGAPCPDKRFAGTELIEPA